MKRPPTQVIDMRARLSDQIGTQQDALWQQSVGLDYDPQQASGDSGNVDEATFGGLFANAAFASTPSGFANVIGTTPGASISPSGLTTPASLDNPPIGFSSGLTTNAGIGGSGATAAQVQQALDESGLSVNGSGVKVGVLSDSFNDLGGAAADEASGALPPGADIQVLEDLSSGGTDEGRAMMQIVHDIAPGADLAFYTAFASEQDFANGILALASAGCKVICDDVSYFDEPFFQNGVVAQAIQTVESEGVTYVTAAGNDASNAYQAAWTPISGSFDGTLLTDAESFGGSIVQTITVGVNSSFDVPLLLEWNQAYGAATSNLEILVFSGGSLVETATNSSNGEPTNPWDWVDLEGGATYQIAIENLSGPNPGLIKEIAAGDGLPVTISGANVGTVYGHAMTPGVISAGAVSAAATPGFGVNPPRSESFSSSGAGTELLFTNNGTALSSPDLLSPVAVSGLDDIHTTVPGGLSDFFGTSAASASLAGVAALILSADPSLTPAQVEAIMQQTALAMANPAVSGAGLVQVDPAVQAALALLTSVVIQTDTNSFGTTKLTQIANNYFLYNGSGSGPELLINDAPVTVGEFGAGWTPIGAALTATGYEVAWKNTTTNQFTVWSTDNNGNYIANVIGIVAANDPALEALEPSFNQDLNGDGTIGVVGVIGGTTIESFGSTSLVEAANNFFLLSISSGSGPELLINGAPVIAGEFGAVWTPIGAEQTATGYDVAWKDTATDQFTVWSTDNNGNYITNIIGIVSSNSPALEALEPTFHQDLNGDGVIGPPAGTTVIESFGVTSLVQVGNNFFLESNSNGTGPELLINGAPVTTGEFGAVWTPIGAEQTATGYDVAWKDTATDQFTVWSADSNGNYITNIIGIVSSNSAALEALEPTFQQDLNDDGVIGIPGTGSVAGASSISDLALAVSNEQTTGTPSIDPSPPADLAQHFDGNGMIGIPSVGGVTPTPPDAEVSGSTANINVGGNDVHAVQVPQGIVDNPSLSPTFVAPTTVDDVGNLVPSTTSGASGDLTINLEFDAAAMAAPASFRAALQTAASILDAAIADPITVNLNIEYGEMGIASTSAEAGPDNGQFEAYSTVRSDLIADAVPGDTTFNSLPGGSTIQGQSQVLVWDAQLKALGLLAPNASTDDGTADFGTAIPQSLLVGVALHELTHALGRVPFGPQPDIFDLFRFTSPGTRLFTDNIPAAASYFSVNGGNTKLADYGENSDPSDFLNPPNSDLTPNDPFNEFYNSNTLQSLTSVDLQQLDALGFNTLSPAILIQADTNSFGTTNLSQAGSNYFLMSSRSAPELMINGAPVTVGEFGAAWTPIGAALTATGYEVAWKNTATSQFTVWSTDNNGNYIANIIGLVAADHPALEGLEPSFNQDLNIDGTIGVVNVTTVESIGSTSLVKSANNFFLLSGGSGPELLISGAPVTAGEFGAVWTPIGAEQTASGYDVGWKDTATDQFTVWDTDSNGNYITNIIGIVSANSLALEALEPTFHQDLNGDGTIGIVGGTTIESFGSTSLVEAANNFFLLSVSSGSGPELLINGAPVTAGEFGAVWTPIGAEQTATGYDVAWKDTATDQFTVWSTDSNGNYITNIIGIVSSNSAALEALEPTFQQDLNDDGVIGIFGTGSVAGASSISDLALAVSNEQTTGTPSIDPSPPADLAQNLNRSGVIGIPDAGSTAISPTNSEVAFAVSDDEATGTSSTFPPLGLAGALEATSVQPRSANGMKEPSISVSPGTTNDAFVSQTDFHSGVIANATNTAMTKANDFTYALGIDMQNAQLQSLIQAAGSFNAAIDLAHNDSPAGANSQLPDVHAYLFGGRPPSIG